MPSRPTGLRPSFPRRPSGFTGRKVAVQWLACAGMLGALCANDAAHAQPRTAASTALVEQGNYWQGQGRADLAEESWRKLLQVDPQSADAMYGMTRVELARNNAEAARGWLARLRSAHPDDNRLARLQQEVQNPGAQNNLLQRARAAARAGQTAEAVQLYRTQFDNGPPPESLALEYYQVLSSTPQGADEGRRGIEQLARDHPDNLNYQLSLAQLKTYSEATRREGIRTLAGLSKQPTVAAAARASWRQALIWLDARAPDAPLYRDYLGEQSDEAVAARLENLSRPQAASAVAGQAVGEGFRALDRSDLAGAERAFGQTLRTQPDDSDALGGMGLVRLRQERFAQAEELLTRASRGGSAGRWASALRSASYWNLIGQANAARDKNDLRGQQALLERAVKLDAREPTGQIALADNRLAADDLAQAETLYQRVLSAKPDNTQALRGLITTYGRQGRPDDALALAKRLPADQAGQLGGLRDIQVEQARAHAKAQGDAGDVAGAQRTLEDAMLAAPDSPWVRLDLANIYRRQGLVSEARGVMDGLLMSQPDMPDALYASALLASDSGDPAAGLQYLDRIPATSRSRDMSQLQRRLWAQGQAQRAQALVRQGNPGAARQVLAQAESTLGSDMPAEIWGQLAGAYAEIGDAPRALAMSRQLLARSPNPGIGDRLLYASVLLKTRQDIELSAVLRQLQNAPMNASQRGDFDSLRIAFALRQTDALREAGNLEAAYNAMAPVLAARPEDPQALAALARLYSAARDERQALALYQHILQRSPGDLDVLLASASSASALREHEEAKNYVMAALKIAPDQSRTLAAAGRVYRNAGDSTRAEQYLRAALVADGRSAGTLPMAGAGAGGFATANPFAGMTGGAPSLPMAAGYPVAAGNPFAGQGGAAAQPAMLPVAYPAAGYPTAGVANPLASTAYPGSYPATATADNAPWPAAAGGATTAANRPASGAGSRNSTRAARGNASNRAGTAATVATSAATDLPPLPPIQPMAPFGYGTAQQQAGGYPVPGTAPAQPYPSSYPAAPYATGGAAGGDTSGWNAALRPSASRAPANPVQSELDELTAQRSTSVSIGTVLRSRAGESGLSSLSDFEVPIQARFPAGEGKIVVGVTPTFLDAGEMTGDFATASRFGGGPTAAYNQAFRGAEAPGSQTASGVGLSVGYEGKNLNANVGTTPLGFAETNVIGNVTLNGNFTDNLSYKADLSRRPVTDSLLSFAGTKDPRTNDRWGGVLATGGRLEMTYDDGTYGLYGYGSAHAITGTNVERNSRFEGGLGLYMHLMDGASSRLTAGMNLGLLGYDKNLSNFTYGQGGYFSPQRFVSVAFPVDWSGRNDRLAWRVNASLGFQSFTQDSSSYFPTDPTRLAAANNAATAAAALALYNTAFTGRYPGSSKTGLAYNLAAVLEYQLAPRLYLGGSVGLSNAQNYRQFTGGVHVRYMFDGATSLGGPAGGMTLNPLTSPYTPLL